MAVPIEARGCHSYLTGARGFGGPTEYNGGVQSRQEPLLCSRNESGRECHDPLLGTDCGKILVRVIEITSQAILMTKGKPMAIKAGVWIDHHRAVVVLIKENGEEVRQIKSNVDKPSALAGGSGSNHSYRRPEDTQEHKFMNQLNTYYDEVRTCLRDADSILILGPGEAKGEFQKRLKSKKFPAHVVDLKTADKMTDRQIAAKVRERFAR